MTLSALAERLAERGLPRPPACDDPGRECGPPPPAELRATEGSLRLRHQARAFVARVLRARTVPELREECKRCGLPVAGMKDELVERLAVSIHGFSTGSLPDTSASPSPPPARRRLSVKSSETPPAKEARASPPQRRRLSIKSPETPLRVPQEPRGSPPQRRRLSVKSPETPRKVAQDDRLLLSVRKTIGLKRRSRRRGSWAFSPRAVWAC